MKLLESSSSNAIKNFVMGDIQEHRDGLTSRNMCGKNCMMNTRDWARPVSTKTEEKIRPPSFTQER